MTDLTELARQAGGDALRARHDEVSRLYQQFAARQLKLNLTRGKPASKQLDLSEQLLRLPGEQHQADGVDCRNYGELQGLKSLRDLLAPFYGVASGAQVVLGDNASLGLMHDAVVYSLLKGTSDSAQPWSREARVAFLCPVPGYDRHFSICRQYGIEMIPVPMTADGPDMDAVERLVASDPQIKGMWCVPKYSNPCGTVYSDATIERLARMKTAAADFRLFWDNAYAVHHLTEQRIEIASILDACERAGNGNRPFIFGSTSKVTFAGAGVSLFAGSAANVKWYLGNMGMRTIGGDKINQLRHLQLLSADGGIDALMDGHREILAPKFDAVLAAFDQLLAGTGVASWTRPQGGYFIALNVLEGCAKRVVELAREAGVELTPAGATHPLGNDPQDSVIRIAPSFPELPEVQAAAEGVAVCVLLAAIEKLQQQ